MTPRVFIRGLHPQLTDRRPDRRRLPRGPTPLQDRAQIDGIGKAAVMTRHDIGQRPQSPVLQQERPRMLVINPRGFQPRCGRNQILLPRRIRLADVVQQPDQAARLRSAEQRTEQRRALAGRLQMPRQQMPVTTPRRG